MADEDKREPGELRRNCRRLCWTSTAPERFWAPIYALIGKLAGEVAYWLPLTFLPAASAAMVNGMMVCAELSARLPSAGGPSAYVTEAMRRPWPDDTIGWMIVAAGVVSAATIISGSCC